MNPQIRLADLILFPQVQMRVLLEFSSFSLLFFEFAAGLIRIWVLFEGGSLSRIYGILFSLGVSLLHFASFFAMARADFVVTVSS